MAARKKSTSGSKKASPKQRKRAEREEKSLRRLLKRGLSSPAVVALLFFAVVLAYGVYLEEGNKEEPEIVVNNFIEKDADIEIRYIDVGQGDCELISYDGKNVLIDAGDRDSAEAIFEVIDGLGIERLDYVIATHPHADHIGSMDKVIERYEIGKVIAPRISNELVPTTKVYERLLTAMSKKGLKLTAAKVGDVYSLADEYSENDNTAFEILAPVRDDYDDLNDWSVAIRLIHGDCGFLFTGDAEKDAENDILESGADVSADILKAGHHGSSTSSGWDFIEAVSPQVVIISCGSGNSYGHPHAETIDMLDEMGIPYYRTDECGTITVYSDGKSYRIQYEKEQNDDR